MWQQLIPALRMTAVLTVLTGILYPALVTGVAQVLFPWQANGSLIRRDGRIVGSRLIGQQFRRPGYFHPRPSAAGDGYDALASGGSNLGPTSSKLVNRVRQAVSDFRSENPRYSGDLPADAVLASASGLDPHISPATAEAQIPRVAATRAVAVERIRDLVLRYTEVRDLGVLGEPRVNVLELNLALDRQFPGKQ